MNSYSSVSVCLLIKRPECVDKNESQEYSCVDSIEAESSYKKKSKTHETNATSCNIRREEITHGN